MKHIWDDNSLAPLLICTMSLKIFNACSYHFYACSAYVFIVKLLLQSPVWVWTLVSPDTALKELLLVMQSSIIWELHESIHPLNSSVGFLHLLLPKTLSTYSDEKNRIGFILSDIPMQQNLQVQ